MDVRAVRGDVQLNSDGLPGVSEAGKVVGALLTFGVIAALAAIAIPTIVWAFGADISNPDLALDTVDTNARRMT